jgi:ELP3 family radical SAM enzyme/protein acetyltransferase
MATLVEPMIDIEDAIKPREFDFSPQEIEWTENILKQIITDDSIDNATKVIQYMKNDIRATKKKYKTKGSIIPKIIDLRYIYFKMVSDGKCEQSDKLEEILTQKNVRVDSGVLVYTIQTDPLQNSGISFHQLLDQVKNGTVDTSIFGENGQIKGAFTCKYDCSYCPNFPLVKFNQNGKKYRVFFPRSYVPGEPSPERAMRNNFDTVLQIKDRARTYAINGHYNDKAELIIEGGTWDSHDLEYRRTLIRDAFYAFNTIYIEQGRPRLSLEEEAEINERTDLKVCHLIGITIETRPDQITLETITEYRKMEITRVQIGIQTTNERVLKKVKRDCTTADAKRAIRLLMDSGFKVDIHIMFGLPGASYQDDIDSLNDLLNDPDLRHDQVKLYPTIIIDNTKIKKLYDAGTYKPYFEENFELLLSAMAHYERNCPRWVRINREQRDVPLDFHTYVDKEKKQLIFGGSNKSNLRQFVDQYMKKNGWQCNDIRTREIRNKKVDPATAQMFIEEYDAAGAKNIHITFETPLRDFVFAILRLRLVPMNTDREQIAEIKNRGIVRELHVYGKTIRVGSKKIAIICGYKVQHMGFGKKLLAKAEEIVRENGYQSIGIISGRGVRSYYHHAGYTNTKGSLYVIKELKSIRSLSSLISLQSLKSYTYYTTPIATVMALYLISVILICIFNHFF